MKKQRDSEIHKILLMLKLNANRVFTRINERMPEYLDDFKLRRTRKYFPEVFVHKFGSVQLETLAQADSETLISLESYFNKIDDLKWYMDHTQDLPTQVEDYLRHEMKGLTKLLETLNLYLDAELGLVEEANDEDPYEEIADGAESIDNDDDDDDIPSLKDL